MPLSKEEAVEQERGASRPAALQQRCCPCTPDPAISSMGDEVASSACSDAHAADGSESSMQSCSQAPQQSRRQAAAASSQARPAAQLDFGLPERPAWRPPDMPSTSQMLAEVTAWSKEHEQLTRGQEAVARQRALRFVVASDIIELVGMADAASTVRLLQGRPISCDASKQQILETLQTHEALLHLQRLQQEMRSASQQSPSQQCTHPTAECILLTEEVVLETHRVLMRGILDNAGRYRDADAFTYTPEGPQSYAKPELVHDKLVCLIDQHNCLAAAAPAGADVALFARLGAWLMHRFVSIHPFSDGNGRIGRLLASFVLSAVCPFPVPMWPSGPGKRASYIAAVRAARSHGGDPCGQLLLPADLAALLVEGVWLGWSALAAEALCVVDSKGGVGMRGELFAAVYDAAAYRSLLDVGLSEEEKQEEQAAILAAIEQQQREQQRQQQQQQVERVSVLKQDTHCVLVWWDV